MLVEVLPRVRDIRRQGAAALDLCSVACGRLDAYYERGLAPWDLAAGGLVATEAGAVVTASTAVRCAAAPWWRRRPASPRLLELLATTDVLTPDAMIRVPRHPMSCDRNRERHLNADRARHPSAHDARRRPAPRP